MSDFGVTVEVIEKVWPHPNADKLELASLVGMTFQFCVVKDFYHAGDKVVYFPVDSLIPENIISLIGLEGRLSGKDKNRVKTIKLRGQISQGVVAEPEAFSSFGVGEEMPQGTDLTELLGVTKYEPFELNVRDGRLVPLPQLVQVYDIEGADRHPEIIDLLLDEEVVITEKIEGSHFSASLYANGDFAVCQRRFRIIPTENLHDWHQMTQDLDLEKKMKQMFTIHNVKHVLTFRGEMIGPGIQSNIYGLSKRRLVFFEVEVDGIPMPPLETVGWIRALGLEFVPVLDTGKLKDLLADKSVREFSTGHTVLPGAKDPDKALREGVVIRPVKERWSQDFGRVIIKQRSPEYLEVTGL